MNRRLDHRRTRPESTHSDDETLDIVRLLIETENRRSEAVPDGPKAATYISDSEPTPDKAAQAKPAATRHTPEAAQHKQRNMCDTEPQPREPILDLTQKLPQSEPQDIEDLRPSRFGRAPRGLRVKMPSIGLRKKSKTVGQHLGRVDAPFWLQHAKLAGLVSVALIIFLKPWLIPMMLFIFVWLALILFLLLGNSRMSDIMTLVWHKFEREKPESAKRFKAWGHRAADRFDGLLARLPESLADGVYSPDLGRSKAALNEDEATSFEEDPFARLAQHHRAAE